MIELLLMGTASSGCIPADSGNIFDFKLKKCGYIQELSITLEPLPVGRKSSVEQKLVGGSEDNYSFSLQDC